MFKSHFCFVNFKSVLSFIAIFKPSRQKPPILAGVTRMLTVSKKEKK